MEQALELLQAGSMRRFPRRRLILGKQRIDSLDGLLGLVEASKPLVDNESSQSRWDEREQDDHDAGDDVAGRELDLRRERAGHREERQDGHSETGDVDHPVQEELAAAVLEGRRSSVPGEDRDGEHADDQCRHRKHQGGGIVEELCRSRPALHEVCRRERNPLRDQNGDHGDGDEPDEQGDDHGQSIGDRQIVHDAVGGRALVRR